MTFKDIKFFEISKRNQIYDLPVNNFEKSIETLRQSGCAVMTLAASAGKLKVMEWLKSKGEYPNNFCIAKNFYGPNMNEMTTPLHIAVLAKEYGVVAWLCEQNIDVNAQTSMGNTAMHFAVMMGDLTMVKLLTFGGANINVVNRSLQTPIYFAAQRGYIDIAKWIYEPKAPLDKKILDDHTLCHLAVEYGCVDVIQSLIDKRYKIDTPNNAKETPLHYAARKGDLKIIDLLIKAGTNIDSRDEDGCTPLYCAVQYSNLDVVKFLYQNGADPCIKDFDNATLIHVAAQNGKLDVIKWAHQELKLEIDLLDVDDESPLHYAARNGEVEIVKYFHSHNCNIHATNFYNETALFLAAFEGHTNVVEYFHNHAGIRVDLSNQDGEYLVHVAACEGHIPLMEWLIWKDADINAQDAEGNTPLHLAIISKEQKMISLLLKNGADVNIQNEYGQTAIICALDHELDASLLFTPESELDLSDPELYYYLIENIDQVLSNKTVRERILVGINIFQAFEDLEHSYEVESFIKNLSKKIVYLIERLTEHLLEDYMAQRDIFGFIGYKIIEIQKLEDIFGEALSLATKSSAIKKALTEGKLKINNFLSLEGLPKNSKNDHKVDDISSKFKHLLEDFEEVSPAKVQKIRDNAIDEENTIEKERVDGNVDIDETLNDSLKVTGEINDES